MNLVAQIAAIPLFAGLPQEQLDRLAMIVVEQTFAKGQSIFLEGEEGTGFYVVASGRVKIFKMSREGKEQILHIFGPPEPFGEVPVFAGQRFPANAEALEDSRIFFFPRAALVEVIRQHPSLAMNMLAVLGRRLRQFAALVEDLSLKEVPARLAAYFLVLSARQGEAETVELDLPKGQLASLLGTIPETLSRLLAKMAKQGLIQSQGNRITLLNRPVLQQLAIGAQKLA
jgi:CRP/FNR family transcriptional regulator